MKRFKEIEKIDNVKRVIKEVYHIDLDISGDWAYNKKRALIIHNQVSNIEQLEHTFAMMRANIEMNLTLQDDEQYGGVNVQEEKRERRIENNICYDIIKYKIVAIPKKIYIKFIQEYKDGYGHDSFDIRDHFRQREENTLKRYVEFWFIID